MANQTTQAYRDSSVAFSFSFRAATRSVSVLARAADMLLRPAGVDIRTLPFLSLGLVKNRSSLWLRSICARFFSSSSLSRLRILSLSYTVHGTSLLVARHINKQQ